MHRITEQTPFLRPDSTYRFEKRYGYKTQASAHSISTGESSGTSRVSR